jgi:uncharacterized protein with FMN-binding domain
MSSKPKIVVFHLKELIYTAIFVILGILLVLLLVFMFLKPKADDNNGDVTASKYVPGVYTSSLVMNNASMEIEVIVDEDHINSIRLVNVDEAVTTIYPLIKSSIESISEQIVENQSLDNITYPDENKYTSLTLIDVIDKTLAKAER